MQHLSQNTTKIFTPKPVKHVQHITLLKLSNPSHKNTFFTNISQDRSELSSAKSSAFSEIIEDLSEIRRDSQNPQERDNSFQIQGKECTIDKELKALEEEIEEMLNFDH